MAESSFVRHEMVASAAPPDGSGSIFGWVRSNLFSGPVNSAVSIFFVGFIIFILWQIIPWVFMSSWTAQSLQECRAQIDLAFGEGTHGACWAVIRERYLQLIYGFYPKEFYWRVNVTFILMLTALAPILFTNLPRILLLVTCVYPFLGYWLLWGGSIWTPFMTLLGIVGGIYLINVITGRYGLLIGVIGGVLFIIFYLLFGVVPISSFLINQVTPLSIMVVDSDQFGGFTLSVIIGATGIAASLPIGILLALGRKSDMLIVRSLSVGFIEFIRGVPLITLLFVASTLLNYFLPPGTNFDIILRVVIMVTLFAAAYIAEVIRGGLAALPVGQYEASNALGLDYWKAMRLIILPQALKISIPGIVSTFIGLFKDTTLVSIIGLLDPLGLSNAIRSDSAWNGIVWELYAFVAVIFFIFCFAMSRYSLYLEKKLATGHR